MGMYALYVAFKPCIMLFLEVARIYSAVLPECELQGHLDQLLTTGIWNDRRN